MPGVPGGVIAPGLKPRVPAQALRGWQHLVRSMIRQAIHPLSAQEPSLSSRRQLRQSLSGFSYAHSSGRYGRNDGSARVFHAHAGQLLESSRYWNLSRTTSRSAAVAKTCRHRKRRLGGARGAWWRASCWEGRRACRRGRIDGGVTLTKPSGARCAASNDHTGHIPVIYIASPYTHAEPRRAPAPLRERVRLRCRAHVAGRRVYSPIAHSHSIVERFRLPMDWNFGSTLIAPSSSAATR